MFDHHDFVINVILESNFQTRLVKEIWFPIYSCLQDFYLLVITSMFIFKLLLLILEELVFVWNSNVYSSLRASIEFEHALKDIIIYVMDK